MCAKIPAAGLVDFEGRARLGARFLERMVDPVTAQPYFAVFDLTPTRATHDWADFVDLAARYFEAACLIEEMTGDAPANVEALREGFTKTFDEETGLFYRPEGPISTHCADLFDQTRALSALCTWVLASERGKAGGDAELARRLAQAAVQGLVGASFADGKVRVFRAGLHGHRGGIDVDPGYGAGPLIRPLVRLARALGDDAALELAVGLAHLILERTDTFTPEGAFASHTHSRLGTAAGIYAAGKAAGERAWCELAYGAYRYVRNLGTSFGFIPEFAGGEQPPTTCETCALMDYVDLMMLLARDDHPELWDEVDRVLHNHLIESQYVRADWGRQGKPSAPSDLCLEDAVADRMMGAFAGWASATQLFGMTPTNDEDWLAPGADASLYVGLGRVAQNCCAPSGIKALHTIWSRAVERRDGTWFVHLVVNRAVPGLRVESRVPGSVRVTSDEDARVALRIPEGVDRDSLCVENAVSHRIDEQGHLDLAACASREVAISFDAPRRTVTDCIDHGPLGEEIITADYVGASVVEMTSQGGPTDQEWRKASTLWGKVPLYRDREVSQQTPEPWPTCRVAGVLW